MYMSCMTCSTLFARELAELQKANAVTQTAAQEAALSAEQSAREELKSILDQQKIVAQREKESLLMQVKNRNSIIHVLYTCIYMYMYMYNAYTCHCVCVVTCNSMFVYLTLCVCVSTL